MANKEAENLPRQFGAYLLFDKIGEGGMARLFLGHQKMQLGGERLVVVKEVLPILADNAEFCRLLTQEAKLAAQLSHGNIAQVIELGREEETLYIAMEYVEGFDLRELLKQCAKQKLPLPVEFSLFIVMEALRGLNYAHKKTDEQGEPLAIVHRDISPSNVLISFDGDVKLCDFGIALAMGFDERLPEGDVKGKAGYMSPEAAFGRSVDARSDVFSVGVILWELLSGRRLYKGQNKKPPTLEQAQAAEIPDLVLRGYENEKDLHEIVMHALKKDPGERLADAEQMHARLEAYVRENKLYASPLKFGTWLRENFSAEILEQRRTRERAARALALGPLVELSPSGKVEPEEGARPAVPSAPSASLSSRRRPVMLGLLVSLALLALLIASVL